MQGNLNGLGRPSFFITGSGAVQSWLGGGGTFAGFFLEAGQWYHLAVMVRENGPIDSIQLYVNSEAAGNAGQRGMESCEGVYFIGRHKMNQAEFMDGLVDEVNETEIPAIWQGGVWSFTTRDFLVVDDFESYTDNDTAGEASGQWAHQDVGITSNAVEPMYVALSNANGASAVVANGDPTASTINIWTEWVIPLQAFADQGANLTNVDKNAIGLGSKAGVSTGGSGTVYIDDIRLYGEEPQP